MGRVVLPAGEATDQILSRVRGAIFSKEFEGGVRGPGLLLGDVCCPSRVGCDGSWAKWGVG